MTARVLFLHGSGGGPNDSTAIYLAKNYTSRTPKMDPSDFKGAVEIQRALLKEFKPEVVVGESFGGAVAFQLMESGDWHGPTVFMCPAVHRIRTRNGITDEPVIPANVPVIILHGTRDDLIPLKDSQNLVNNAETPNSVQLHMVDDDHMMRGVVERKDLRKYVDMAIQLGGGTAAHVPEKK
ncbi:hypothetical protein HDV00_003189 [Rhizophlyctis rosea]|nr:hypothetical protein HDV00_003189 [Rhizophlyctis rosea]